MSDTATDTKGAPVTDTGDIPTATEPVVVDLQDDESGKLASAYSIAMAQNQHANDLREQINDVAEDREENQAAFKKRDRYLATKQESLAQRANTVAGVAHASFTNYDSYLQHVLEQHGHEDRDVRHWLVELDGSGRRVKRLTYNPPSEQEPS